MQQKCFTSSDTHLYAGYYSSPLVIWNIWGDGWSRFPAYPDHQRETPPCRRHTKKLSPDAKVKLLKPEILHLRVYINYYYFYYFNGKYFVIVWPKFSWLPGDVDLLRDHSITRRKVLNVAFSFIKYTKYVKLQLQSIKLCYGYSNFLCLIWA
jgi:hypothetical protein